MTFAAVSLNSARLISPTKLVSCLPPEIGTPVYRTSRYTGILFRLPFRGTQGLSGSSPFPRTTPDRHTPSGHCNAASQGLP